MGKNLRLDFLKMIMEKLLRFKNWVILGGFIIPFLAFGQSTTKPLDYTLLRTLEISSPVFTTDQLRNVYTVETGAFDLFNLDVIDVPAVGISSDNKLWIYDDLKFNLKKIDRNGDVVDQSNNLSLVLGKTLTPNFLLERSNAVYVNDPEVGILVFDLFSNYTKTIGIKGLDQFQVIDQQLVYWQDGALHIFNLKSLQTRSIDLQLPPDESQLVRIEKDRLYVRTGPFLKIYQINN